MIKKIVLVLSLLVSFQISTQAQYVSTLTDLNQTMGDGITVARTGDIFYSSGFGTNFNKIFKITPEGEVSVYKENISNPVGIISDSLLNLYVPTYQGNAVRKIDTAGTVTTIASNLDGPAGVVLNKSGDLFVSEYGANGAGNGNRIIKINTDGSIETHVTNPAFSGLIGITIDEEENLYTSNWGNGNVFKITPEKEVTVLASLGENVNQISYSNGYVLAPSPSADKIFRVDTKTGAAEVLAGSGRPGNKNGVSVFAEFSRPNGIAPSISGDTLYFNDGGIVKMITGVNLPRINLKGEYQKEEVLLNVGASMEYDSLQVIIDEERIMTYLSTSAEDSMYSVEFKPDETRKADVYVFGYSDSTVTVSSLLKITLLSFSSPVETYHTDFDERPINDFLLEGFSIQRNPAEFSDYQANTPHNYFENAEYIMTLRKPIKVKADSSEIVYKDVAIVEPGLDGSVFGTSEFKDYVVVEGNNGNGWVSLGDGYDARFDSAWLNRWPNNGNSEELFRPHTFNLLNSFSAGDSVLIRFRLFSDNEEAGYGWVISEISIQDGIPTNSEKKIEVPNSVTLNQNYPNPFNPVTTIIYFLPESGKVKLSVFDITGRLVSDLVDKSQTSGEHRIIFDAANLSSGVYFYRLSFENGFSRTNKMSLIK